MTNIEAAEILEELTACKVGTASAALRLGAAALRESEWLPIEGAPKDGTPFDVWFAKEGRRLANVRWVLGDSGYFHDDNGWPLTGILEAGWITLYRPLPSPPKEQGNG